jgi:ketosteroid isomerase-like protein
MMIFIRHAIGFVVQSVSKVLGLTTSRDSAAEISDPISITKRAYKAYVDKDRSVIEQLIADDFHFTSPLDNRIDRRIYFERCWPNSEWITDFKFIHILQEGSRVFVTYEGRSTGGKGFRNTEIITVRQGQIVEVEVYFGWSLPHEAPSGGFTGPGVEV